VTNETSPKTTQIDAGVTLIDLQFQGNPGVVAAYLVRGLSRTILIEAGPGSTIDTLVAGLHAAGTDVGEIDDLFVTHIHLDHAGSAGLLAEMNPRLKVHAHPFGVPHLIDPSKLVASATRIYGDQMETLWGRWVPIPEDRVVPIEHGERIELGWRALTAWFTPGHARHHVAYLDEHQGDLYTGDVAGIHLPGAGYVLPPTPPPEFDPDAWGESIALMRSMRPIRLLPTHFGPTSNPKPGERLDQLAENLARFIEIGETSFAASEDQDALTERFHAELTVQAGGDDALLARYELASPSYMAAMGMTRYLTKRQA
jgi:glyoxylase-like metal-dependent hydrolase (beta-lactamase superfamily II)